MLFEKYLLSRVDNQLALRTAIVAISMVERSHGFFRSSLSVCKSRVESGVQCMTNGTENSTSTLAKN